jgi:hypothetical protein
VKNIVEVHAPTSQYNIPQQHGGFKNHLASKTHHPPVIDVINATPHPTYVIR